MEIGDLGINLLWCKIWYLEVMGFSFDWDLWIVIGIWVIGVGEIIEFCFWLKKKYNIWLKLNLNVLEKIMYFWYNFYRKIGLIIFK